MYLEDFTELAKKCRDNGFGLAEFVQQEKVGRLRWPHDVLEQWLYDHAGNDSFLRDYKNVDLSRVEWQVEPLLVETFMEMPTGPSDSDVIEYFAENSDHWTDVRKYGEHMGVKLSWEVHGTWKRWPVVIDRILLQPHAQGLQLIEGRNRVGIMRGRNRRGQFVAHKHLAWVGRPRT